MINYSHKSQKDDIDNDPEIPQSFKDTFSK
jgi:hypothetical protein